MLICYDFLGKFKGGDFAPASTEAVPTGHDHDRVLASYADFLVPEDSTHWLPCIVRRMHSAQSRRIQYGSMLSKIVDNGRRFMCSTLAVRHFGSGGGLDAVAYASELIWTRDVDVDPLSRAEEIALSRVMADLRVLHRLPVADFAKVWGISLLLDVPKNVTSTQQVGAGSGNGMNGTTVQAYETSMEDWLAEAVKQTNAPCATCS